MYKVSEPAQMNETFARAFNSRDVKNLLALYEPEAVLCTDALSVQHRGIDMILKQLEGLLTLPGHMVSQNNFCIRQGDIALLRADYVVTSGQGEKLISGSSAEVVRRQSDGSWLYLIDHAAGASLPAMDNPGSV